MKALLLLIGLTVSSVHGQYNYHEVLGLSILFYEAERSGYLPDTNRIAYRGDSATTDGADNGVDLSGGWYDAGDHVKFGFPMAWSTTVLAWGVWTFKQGYIDAGQKDYVLDSIRWPLDYFVKAHVSNNEFFGQCGDGNADHAYWGRPEQMTMYRPCSKITTTAPGSDLAGETVAALAAGSLAFKGEDDAYAATLLQHARTLYEFAYNYRGLYSNSIGAGGFYSSSGFNDELAWGAVWLYLATGEQQYLTRAQEFYSAGTPWSFSWDDKNAGVQLLMYQATGDAQYRTAVEGFLNSWYPGGSVTYTPKGLAWRDQWGSLRYAANTAAIAVLAYHEGIQAGNAQSLEWARGQIHYMLGDGGRSFVVGYGNNPPCRPHHRSSSCSPDWGVQCDWDQYNSPDCNPSVLSGALVGGPDQYDNYVDSRADYIANEVANDYNAGFQTAVAGLMYYA